jgi:hypothetical protein
MGGGLKKPLPIKHDYIQTNLFTWSGVICKQMHEPVILPAFTNGCR